MPIRWYVHDYPEILMALGFSWRAAAFIAANEARKAGHK